METIRKGIEFTVEWEQLINGVEEDLSVYDLSVFLVYPNGRKKQVEYTKEDVCRMTVTVLPEMQKELDDTHSKYGLTVTRKNRVWPIYAMLSNSWLSPAMSEKKLREIFG